MVVSHSPAESDYVSADTGEPWLCVCVCVYEIKDSEDNRQLKFGVCERETRVRFHPD